MELKIRDLYIDFFDFIIWDVLKPLFGNISIDVPIIELKKEIGQIFVEGALKYKVNYPKISEILKKHNIEEPILDYIIDMLSKFANRLDSYFLKDIKDPTSVYEGKQLTIMLRDFNNIISEYVIISYFDLVMLKQAISLLSYSSDLSLADIFQIRMQCLDIFKTAMSDNVELGIGEILASIREKLEIVQDEKLINLVMVQFTSFFEFLVSSENINNIIHVLKHILSQQVFDYRQSTPFVSTEDVELITEWFKKQVIDLPIAMLQKMYSVDLKYDIEEVKNEFLELFKLFIQGTITIEKLEKKLIVAGKKIGVLEKFYKMEDNILEFFELKQSLDLIKNHSLNKIRTKFDFNIPNLPDQNGEKNIQENINIIILIRVFDNIISYCEFIEDERSIDPTLKRLVTYIKQKIEVADSLYI